MLLTVSQTIIPIFSHHSGFTSSRRAAISASVLPSGFLIGHCEVTSLVHHRRVCTAVEVVANGNKNLRRTRCDAVASDLGGVFRAQRDGTRSRWAFSSDTATYMQIYMPGLAAAEHGHGVTRRPLIPSKTICLPSGERKEHRTASLSSSNLDLPWRGANQGFQIRTNANHLPHISMESATLQTQACTSSREEKQSLIPSLVW